MALISNSTFLLWKTLQDFNYFPKLSLMTLQEILLDKKSKNHTVYDIFQTNLPFTLEIKKVSQKLFVSFFGERKRGVQESSEVGVNHVEGQSLLAILFFVFLSPTPFLKQSWTVLERTPFWDQRSSPDVSNIERVQQFSPKLDFRFCLGPFWFWSPKLFYWFFRGFAGPLLSEWVARQRQIAGQD